MEILGWVLLGLGSEAALALLVILALRRAARQLSERPVVDLRDSGATTAEPVLPAGTIVN